jgi:spore coat protein JB
VELELYLDTHPNCRTALDYYHRTVEALESLMTKYHNEQGPLRAEGVVSDDTWTWVKEPWPWQAGNGAVNERGER